MAAKKGARAKVKRQERTFLVDVKWTKGRGFEVTNAEQVAEQAAAKNKLGIDQVDNTAKFALRILPDNEVEVTGLNTVLRSALNAQVKAGRC